MGNPYRPRRGQRPGRARDAAADDLFERALLGEVADEDATSSTDPRRRFDARSDRKTLQLCRQVQRALSLSLAGDGGDELLQSLYVQSVQPLGSAGQLAVAVVLPPEAGANAGYVLARLAAHTPRLRAAVAREITRKRVPNLSFIVLPPDEPKGGNHVD